MINEVEARPLRIDPSILQWPEVTMKIIESKSNSVVVELSEDDLGLINNALNEVCNGIDIPEFATRLGASRERAEELLRDVGVELTKLESRRK
jgi:hypothetical protein